MVFRHAVIHVVYYDKFYQSREFLHSPLNHKTVLSCTFPLAYELIT